MHSANRKILHLINGEFYSGAERVQDLLAQGLPEYGFEPWLACLKPDKFMSRCACDRSRVMEFPMRSRFDIPLAMKIARYVQANGFALVHTHTPRTAMLGLIVSRIAAVPLIHHLHSPTSRDTEHSIRNRINSFVETLVINRVNRIIAVSYSLQEYLLRLEVSKNRISVVWNGVPSLPELPESRAPDGEWVVGVVALFRARKGLEVLLQAMASLNAAGYRIRLRAIGEFESEDYKREVLDLVNNLGIASSVDWIGFVRDVEAELKKVNIFVLPSLFGEGLPMVVLEAMANGVPVISTRVEGVPEAIPDTDIGTLVEPGDVEQMAEAIQSLIASPELWEEQRTQAYQRQVKYLSSRSMSAGVAKVYEEVLAG